MDRMHYLASLAQGEIKRVLDEWHDTVNQTYSFNRQLDGKHELEVRFYENVGDARIHFWWTRVSDLPVPQ